MYLLGAGASYDAGLPLSLGLTDRIGELISKREGIPDGPYGYGPEIGMMTQVYYATRALLQAGDIYAGRSPMVGVDIERIFSAAQALATSSKSELAPFVQQWREPFQLQSDPTEWLHFLNAVQSYNPDYAANLRTTSKPAPPMPDFQQVYSRLCVEICKELPEALTAKHPDKHKYLLPMLQEPGVTPIATLNYDLGVEQAAKLGGLVVDTGITNWRGGLRWRWGQLKADVQLLKLHGSLGWGRPYGEGGYVAPGTPRITAEQSECYKLQFLPETYDLQPPGLIFGVRNKLRPDGPFMAMLHEFWTWLEGADRLVIIGYSFRDEHINNLIEDWITTRIGAVLEIVDPSIPKSWLYRSHSTPNFVSQALDFHKHEAPGCPAYPSSWSHADPQFKFHRQGAADWIKSLTSS